MAKNYTYSDFNMSFIKHPISYDIAKRFDEEAIRAAIKSANGVKKLSACTIPNKIPRTIAKTT